MSNNKKVTHWLDKHYHQLCTAEIPKETNFRLHQGLVTCEACLNLIEQHRQWGRDTERANEFSSYDNDNLRVNDWRVNWEPDDESPDKSWHLFRYTWHIFGSENKPIQHRSVGLSTVEEAIAEATRLNHFRLWVGSPLSRVVHEGGE